MTSPEILFRCVSNLFIQVSNSFFFSSSRSGSSTIKRNLPHFLQNSSSVSCSILHCGQMTIFASNIFHFLKHYKAFTAFNVPYDELFFIFRFHSFFSSLKELIVQNLRVWTKIVHCLSHKK